MAERDGTPVAGSAPDIESMVGEYYTQRLREHGPTPAGVDWNSQDSQSQRFTELCRPIDPGMSVLDVGCGYGAMFEHLISDGWSGEYVGYDVSSEMIDAARLIHDGSARFTDVRPEAASADYVVGSGLFNVKLETDVGTWGRYVSDTLDAMFDWCRVGMAFNVLTSYSDADRQRPDLYYASPSELFDLCATRFSRHVALRHDYGLYEFTIVVRR